MKSTLAGLHYSPIIYTLKNTTTTDEAVGENGKINQGVGSLFSKNWAVVHFSIPRYLYTLYYPTVAFRLHLRISPTLSVCFFFIIIIYKSLVV